MQALIKDNDILNDFIDETGQPKNAAAHEIKVNFNKKIGEIQSIGNNYDLSPGSLLQLISRQFKYYSWRFIPWGELDNIKTWIINNYYRYYSIIEPEKHNQLIANTNHYSTWFRSEELKHTTQDSYIP